MKDTYASTICSAQSPDVAGADWMDQREKEEREEVRRQRLGFK